jgi:hypothetical protein
MAGLEHAIFVYLDRSTKYIVFPDTKSSARD